MAHGMFKIKVVKMMGGDELLNYAAPTYPQKGETLVVEGKRFIVSHVDHIVRSERDSAGEYHTLDHVRVEVCK